MVSVAFSSSAEEPKLTIQSFHQCSSLVSIKLSNSNFLLWKFQMLSLIRSMGLEHHITSTSKPDDEITDSSGTGTKNPNVEWWILNDGLLISWLLGNMKEEVLSMILGGDTTHYIWSSLHEQLLPNTKEGETEAQLKNSIYAITKGNLSLQEYIREFKELCDKLSAIEKPLSDVDKVLQFSKGLGNKYKSFQIAVLSKPPYPSFNQFIMSLQNFEQVYLAEENPSINNNQTSLSLRGRVSNMHGGRGNIKGRGSQNYNQNRPRKQNRETCQICGKTNHIASMCYYRYEYNNVGENSHA
jgi:hypothetical protein